MEIDDDLEDILKTCNPGDFLFGEDELFSDSNLLESTEFPADLLIDTLAKDFGNSLEDPLNINFCNSVKKTDVSYQDECKPRSVSNEPFLKNSLCQLVKETHEHASVQQRGHQRSTSAGYISVIKSNDYVKGKNVQCVKPYSDFNSVPVVETRRSEVGRPSERWSHPSIKPIGQVQPGSVVKHEVKQVVLQPQVVHTGAVKSANLPTVLTYTSTPTSSVTLPTTTIVTTGIGLPLILDGDQLYTIQTPVNNGNSADRSIDVLSSSPRRGGEGKKTSHNAIERRYRSNINDKMVELKNIVAGDDAKLSKSQILKKAIEKIRYLQSANERLIEENQRLRLASGQSLRFEDLLTTPVRHLQEIGQITPPHSDMSDAASPFSSSSDAEPVSPSSYPEKKKIKISDCQAKGPVARAMIDRSRVTLCMFTLAVLVFNPFGRVFEKFYDEEDLSAPNVVAGRTLKFFDEPSFLDTVSGMSLLLTSVVNIILLTFVFLRLFVYGEPIPDEKSEAMITYWRHRKQADSDYETGAYHSSAKQYTLALSALGRSLPTSRFDAFSAVLWQSTRQILHRLGLGKWLGARAGGLFLPKVKRVAARSVQSEIAFCYHRLHQLHLTNHLRLFDEALPTTRVQCLHGFSLCLAALNMAEGAGPAMRNELLAEVYMTTAVRMKVVFNSKRKIMARFFLRKARDVCTKLGSAVPPHLQWLCSPHGHRFFLRFDWSFVKTSSPVFTKSERKGDPLCLLMQMYREYVLRCAFDAVISPNRPSEENDAARIAPQGDAQTYIHLLDGICSAPPSAGDELKGMRIEEYDSVCGWWGSLLSAATYWLLGDNDKVSSLHSRIEAGPGCSNLLPFQNAIMAAYRSRRLVACKAREEVCYKQISKASRLLKELVAMPPCSPDPMTAGALLIAYDWVLEARTTLWEQVFKGQEVPPPHILSWFQDDLATMRKLTQQFPAALPKLFPHELTVRAMAGGATAAQERRSLRHRMRHLHGRGDEDESGSSSSDREEIAALMRGDSSPTIEPPAPIEKVKNFDVFKKKNDDFGVIKNIGSALITLQNAAR